MTTVDTTQPRIGGPASIAFAVAGLLALALPPTAWIALGVAWGLLALRGDIQRVAPKAAVFSAAVVVVAAASWVVQVAR